MKASLKSSRRPAIQGPVPRSPRVVIASNASPERYWSAEKSSVIIAREIISKAVVWPWRRDKAVWEELRYSMRSVERHFEDKECPFLIVGDHRPDWIDWSNPGRVRFIQASSYTDAIRIGTGYAEQVIWMNDDIFLVKPCSWNSFLPALHMERLEEADANRMITSGNTWRRGLGNAVRLLSKNGRDTLNFSTHTPYLYERDKVDEILRTYGIWHKITLETLYYNHHRIPGVRLTGEKAKGMAFGGARYLNVTDGVLTSELRNRLKTLFSARLDFEKPASTQNPRVSRVRNASRAVARTKYVSYTACM